VEAPKKKEVKKEISFATSTGKNDLDFEEVKGREKVVGQKKRQRHDSLDDHSSGPDSDDDYYVPPPRKGDAAKKKLEEKR